MTVRLNDSLPDEALFSAARYVRDRRVGNRNASVITITRRHTSR